MKDTSVIIVAGGLGTRMGRPKQLLKICGKEVLRRSIEHFYKLARVKEIIIVTYPATFKVMQKYFNNLKFAPAGSTRLESVKNGLVAVSKSVKLIAVHDGARPLVKEKHIAQCLMEAQKHKATVLGVFVKDTIKVVKGAVITKTLDRKTLFSAQTPQCYQAEILRCALKKYGVQKFATDESQLVEKLGIKVKAIVGDFENIKITTPEDLIIAEGFLCQKNK